MKYRNHSSLALATLLTTLSWSETSPAAHGRYRLTWRDDPATTMVIGWDQQGGQQPRVYWDKVDHGTSVAAYANSRAPDRVVQELGMNNHFVRLSGLEPDTAYYFVVADDGGPSARYWFKTAPSTLAPFTAIAGGDSRNNREPRRNGNRAVAKLRPLFVLFGGDYTDSNDAAQWQDWFDDWQSATSPDGRMYPLIATRGNHDSNTAVERLWDSPHADVYFGLSVAGGLGRFYTLNSEIAPGGNQAAWLTNDLADHRCDVFRMAQYHRPMRPHTSGKAEGDDLYDAWAKLFFDEGMDLVVECDSHTVKRTWPVAPAASAGDQGFVRDDSRGTVYIGEGCWGAPLREDDDAKSWTRAHGSFNEVNWLQFHQDRMEIRTVMTDAIDQSGSVSDADPFTPPAGLPVWEAAGGSVLTVPARERDPRCGPPGSTLLRYEAIPFGSEYRYRDDGQDQGGAWREPSFDDSTWPIGAAELGFGEADEVTTLFKSDPNYPSYYFRARFELPAEATAIVAADLQARYDDGLAIWLNGTPVFTGDVDDLGHSAYASAVQGDAKLVQRSIDVGSLHAGTNVLAAMVKQGSASSSDLSFDLALTISYVQPEAPAEGGSGAGGAAPAGMAGMAGSAGQVPTPLGGSGGAGSEPPAMQQPGPRPATGDDIPSARLEPAAMAPGCGCGIPGRTSAAPWFAVAGLAAALWRRRRREVTTTRAKY